MKNSTLVQFKIDPAIKKQADILLSDLGLDTPTLLRMCLNQVVIQQKVPFEIGLSNQNVSTNPNINLNTNPKPILKENSVTKTLETINSINNNPIQTNSINNNLEEDLAIDHSDDSFENF